MNGWRWLVFLVFFLEQNQYFGWHAWPQSDAEIIADGITMLMLTFSFTGKKP